MSEHTEHMTEQPEQTAQTDKSAVIAVYDTHAEAEAAIRDLEKSGFDMTKLSIVGKDFHTEEHVVGYYSTGDRMKAWGTTGAFWGGIWSLMFGSAFSSFPASGRCWPPGRLWCGSSGRSKVPLWLVV